MNLGELRARIKLNPAISWIARKAFEPIEAMASAVVRLIRKRIWVNGTTVKYDGVDLTFPANVGVMYATSIYWNGTDGFEPHTWRVLRALVERADLFIDVGSNIGFYSVLARLVKPSIKVLAFEPVQSIYDSNIRFHVANGVASLGLANVAISDKIGEATIFLPSTRQLVEKETTATLREDSWQANGSHERHLVSTTTLDELLLGRVGTGKIVIKIDVEDHEAAVFRGGRVAIAKHQPLIVCEMLPRPHGNVETVEILRSLDYELMAITPSGLFRFGDGDFREPRSFTDFLALPSSQLGDRGCLALASFSDLWKGSQ